MRGLRRGKEGEIRGERRRGKKMVEMKLKERGDKG